MNGTGHSPFINMSNKKERTLKKLPLKMRLKNYLKENWGAPFVIGFMILLSTAAVYLSIGNETLADELAVYAYYSLVLGVLLQLISYIRSND